MLGGVGEKPNSAGSQNPVLLRAAATWGLSVGAGYKDTPTLRSRPGPSAFQEARLQWPRTV